MFKIALMGSRYFGAQVFETLRKEPGVQIAVVVAPAADDRLAVAAQAAGVPLHVLANPKVVPGEAVPEGTDLIVAAHTHARVSNEALDRSRLRGVGYHPSLLPRHRGIAAVEWTVLEGDPIAGGSVYHLADGWDAGAIAAQDWCFVGKGEGARGLWERALAPLGLRLLAEVARHARDHGTVPAKTQDPRFATRAPMLRKAAVKAEGAAAPATTSLVVLVVGPDRPGIVRQIAERAARHGANWAASRMSSVAGEFAGMVQLELDPAGVPALTEALRGLESAGLRVVVSAGEAAELPAGSRAYELQLVGEDRVGIVSQFTTVLAERGVSIDSLHTELQQEDNGRPKFKVSARVRVPRGADIEALKRELDALAQKLMLDVALDDRAG